MFPPEEMIIAPGKDGKEIRFFVPLEIPPNRAAMSIASGNEFLRKATQVAYDVGKIDGAEYKQRMGFYCDALPQNCGKCIVYKLTCKP